MSPKRNVKTSPPRNEPPIEFPKCSPPKDSPSPPKCKVPSPPLKVTSPPTGKNVFTAQNHDKEDNAAKNNYITLSTKVSSPPKTDKLTSFSGGVLSNIQKFNRVVSKNEDDTTKVKKEVAKEMPLKTEKLSLPAPKNNDTKPSVNEPEIKQEDKSLKAAAQDDVPKKVDTEPPKADDKSEENNGVGDKIRIFEKAAEDASANAGRLSRPGSVRGRSRTERLGSDSDLPPPATPFKDNIFFENNSEKTNTLNHKNTQLERQPSLTGSVAAKWQRNDSNEEKIQKPEPQKIIKPEFKPMPSPVDLTIRSPSLGAKIPDQFPSQGTAFRNVASPDTARTNANKAAEDLKAYKLKNKQKLSVSKGTSYFSSVSNEVWLVKKKDIEEIEERVLDSFRRAGGNVCMRSETMRPSSDSGQSAFTHATMGRKRQMYARSESLDPQWANSRAQTLKRQSSVACTCGHDKKTKGKSAETSRPRSRSHGDENNQSHVLDKYETLV